MTDRNSLIFDRPEAPDNEGIAETVTYPAIYNRSDSARLKRVSSLSGAQCQDIESIDICGNGMTDRDGTVLLRLHDYLCVRLTSDRRPTAPLYFVATPMSAKPVLLTFEFALRDTLPEEALGFDVRVFTWDLQGGAQGLQRFQWRACSRTTIGVIE